MIKQLMMVCLLFFCTSVLHAEQSDILEQVESSARSWLSLVDQGKYKESWQNSSPLFKTKRSESDWVKSITAIRASRESISARYIATAGSTQSLSGLPDGDYIVLQFYTTFGTKGLALETITLTKVADKTWQIVDYASK